MKKRVQQKVREETQSPTDGEEWRNREKERESERENVSVVEAGFRGWQGTEIKRKK